MKCFEKVWNIWWRNLSSISRKREKSNEKTEMRILQLMCAVRLQYKITNTDFRIYFYTLEIVQEIDYVALGM